MLELSSLSKYSLFCPFIIGVGIFTASCFNEKPKSHSPLFSLGGFRHI